MNATWLTEPPPFGTFARCGECGEIHDSYRAAQACCRPFGFDTALHHLRNGRSVRRIGTPDCINATSQHSLAMLDLLATDWELVRT